MFTADATLALVADGRLALDTRLLELFPELPEPNDSRIEGITILHLLTHSAGFDRHASTDPMFRHHHEPWCPYNLGKLASIRLDYSPGERQVYSNRGYCLLGQVVERLTGYSYREHVTEVYGLQQRGLRFVDGPYAQDEVQYDFRSNDFYGPNYPQFFDFHALSSVAGLSGNAEALAVTVQRMLAREQFGLLTAPLRDPCDMTKLHECFGYGLYLYRPGRLQTFIHEGALPGTMPILMVDSQGGVTVLLTSGSAMEMEQKKLMIDGLYGALENHYFGKVGSEPNPMWLKK